MPIEGFQPTWVIESQFEGNPRLLPGFASNFLSATDTMRAKLLNDLNTCD